MFARSLARCYKSSSLSSFAYYSNNNANLATLRVHGPDSKGIVATCSNILDQRGYEIVATEHWTDHHHHHHHTSSHYGTSDNENLLFLRIAFDKDAKSSNQQSKMIGNATTCSTSSSTEKDLHSFCSEKGLSWTLNWRRQTPKVAIMVSKYDHCLWELLLKRQQAAHELDCDIVAVVSNHETLKPVAKAFDIPFYMFPITADNKQEQECRQVQLLKHQLHVDIVVLARYMQVLTPIFLNAFLLPSGASSIINIHHSFLPAFSGCRPYHAAWQRGVKLIGATAHYATAELDQGPIIAQVSVYRVQWLIMPRWIFRLLALDCGDVLGQQLSPLV
jgi:formyltetrahydrofolate deformylase